MPLFQYPSSTPACTTAPEAAGSLPALLEQESSLDAPLIWPWKVWKKGFSSKELQLCPQDF